MVETKISASNSEILSTEQKRNGFHGKYLALCKLKNLMPVPEVKAKQRNFQVLDFHADRIKTYDWLAICSSLINDKSLKFVAIRLRKNSELVLEEIDTLKKAKTIVTHPVIYSKFLFAELLEALQHLMANNNQLETLIIEGFPLYGRYMSTFTKGLGQNNTIKTLSLARSQIGDEACDSVCSTVKHLVEIETLILSGCNLSVKGAESVAGLIKFQKIQRYSEAWTQSLRYRNIDADTFSGLRKISLNNNPQIGNEGLAILMESLCEDVWIKDIEMQNCGLDDEGAQSIIKCLSINKTILNFNIAGNPEVSEHFCRQILINLGKVDHQDNSDSTDSKSSSTETITKAKLLENLNYLQDQLEIEVFRRKQMELMNDKLSCQLIEAQKELSVQGAIRVPEGFTLIANEALNELLDGKPENPLPRVIRNHRKHRLIPRKVRSVIVPKAKYRIEKSSKSEHLIKSAADDGKKPDIVERNIIGDTRTTTINCNSMNGADLLKMFAKKKKETHPPDDASVAIAKNTDPRHLFFNSAKIVPQNSDADDTDEQ